MPEFRRRGTATVATAAVLLVVLAPAALAETEEPTPTERQQQFWSGSTMAEPFTEFETVVNTGTLDIRGRFVLEPELPSDRIELVTVTFSDDPLDDFVPREGCSLPDPAIFPATDDPETVSNTEMPFEVLDARLPCNGRYLISAVGRANRADIPEYELLRAVLVAERPAPITEVEATLAVIEEADGDDAAVEEVTITFQPLPPEQRPVDLEGYRVERAGPADGGGHYGVFEAVGDDIAPDGDPTVVDVLEPPGAYRYRVRAVRSGQRQQVLSSPSASPTVDVRSGEPTEVTTTTTSEAGGTTVTSRTNSRIGRTVPRAPTRRVVSVPTTADTGFEEELDYGDLPAVDPLPDDGEEFDDELGAGQSIVREEGEETNLLVPVAGALVLIGWAGHLVYLNRLAKHL